VFRFPIGLMSAGQRGAFFAMTPEGVARFASAAIESSRPFAAFPKSVSSRMRLPAAASGVPSGGGAAPPGGGVAAGSFVWVAPPIGTYSTLTASGVPESSALPFANA
jgi:hypothetical protein